MIAQSNSAPVLATDGIAHRRTLQIVCADPALARRYLRALERGGALYEFVLAISAADALRNSGLAAPLVTLLDETAVEQGDLLLRHEVNNPLTGILGNAELLLARRDHLTPAAIERLETIAELAVRLRETVRRLSHNWQERHDQVHSA